MAQKTIVQFTDDLDGSEASQTVEFGYEGKTYKLDLNDRNAAELAEALAPYIAAAQRADGGRGRGGRRGKARTPAASQQRSGDGRDYTRRQCGSGLSRRGWRCQRAAGSRARCWSSSRPRSPDPNSERPPC